MAAFKKNITFRRDVGRSTSSKSRRQQDESSRIPVKYLENIPEKRFNKV
jgi:hypothetical protein